MAPHPSAHAALDWPVVLLHLSRRARTLRGQARALDLPLAGTRDEVVERYGEVAELMTLQEMGEHMPLAGIADVAEEVSRSTHTRMLAAEELRDIGKCLVAMLRLRAWTRDAGPEAPGLLAAGEGIVCSEELAASLDASFESDGSVSGRRYPVVAELRQQIANLQGALQGLLRTLLQDERYADALQDRFITERAGRYVIPVKPSAARSIGIVHAASQSGETLFVEPAEVVERTNRLKEHEHALEREITRILVELTARVGREADAILRSLDAATHLDLVAARLDLGVALRGRVPTVGHGGVISLKQARHPVLELRGIDVVANDLSLSDRSRALILSGPNTGGKTVALKTLGLAALLARAGIPVPADDGSRVDLFSPILADVGDTQSVEGDLSTFSGHVEVLKGMLRAAGEGALILLDEVGVGTDPAQGAALARAVLEALVDAGARIAVTTHYAELKALGAADPRCTLAAVQYADGRPTYRVVAGLAGESHALATARRLDLPAAIIERARALMERQTRELADLMEELEQSRGEALERARALEASRRDLDVQRRRLEQREAALEARRKTLQEEVASRFRERLRAREQDVKGLIAALQDQPDLKLAGRTLAQLRQVRADVEGEIASTRPELPPPPEEGSLSVGDVVRVRSLGKSGTITRDLGRGRFEVRVGKLPMQLKVADLAPGSGRAAPRRPPRPVPAPTPARVAEPEPSAGGLIGELRMDANTCDLRGMRVSAALDELDRFFARLVAGGYRMGWILHGHGTGALKKAVRESLPHHPQVRQWRPANADEGGDAFTLIGV